MNDRMQKIVGAALAAFVLTAGQVTAATLEEERDSYDAEVDEGALHVVVPR